MKRIYLMKNWKFSETFQEDYISTQMEGGKVVSLPHTVKETPYNYFDESVYQMVSTYQLIIEADLMWMDQSIVLTFEAVGHEADVYFNGKHLANHKNGYTAFSVDLTDEMLYGRANLLTVRVDSRETLNQPPFGFVMDYMTYGGIYRDVYLEVRNKKHIVDAFLKPSFSQRVNTKEMSAEEIAKIRTTGVLETSLTLSREAKEMVVAGRLGVRQSIDGVVILQAPIASMAFSTIVKDIAIWDVESPSVYDVTTELIYDGKAIDEMTQTVGFREARFEEDGFYLNGRKLKIRGLNRHQSYAYVGYAMPESMQRYDAWILKKELSVNAVRTSHYPQSHYFIDECDRLGLLVFMEFPGWQHIGDDAWKDIAVANVREMVEQYRNHASIILWGVRINESQDDDAFYERTNAVAHECDPTRQTGGVRFLRQSNLLEDVYTYNDFYHTGDNEGCETKEKVTSNNDKPYLISEYCGHMYPTKAFDWEEHRRNHMLRHATILDAIAAEDDIVGSFGWCMFDYNTHRDFGSGDRICYHGVLDMFRNPKLAASVYAAQGENVPVLEISSSMDIGEHPASNRGKVYILSNADSVRMYKDNILIKEYKPKDSHYKHLQHAPILIDDFIGDLLFNGEDFTKRQAKLIKDCLNAVAVNGMKATPSLAWNLMQLVVIYHMNPNEAVPLYNKYIGDWGGTTKQYRFDAIKDGKVVKSVIKDAMTEVYLKTTVSHTVLKENITYDVAEIRVKAVDEYANQLFYMSEPVLVETEGPIEIIGPRAVPLRGGVCGIYVKSMGKKGDAKVKLSIPNAKPVTIDLQVICNGF